MTRFGGLGERAAALRVTSDEVGGAGTDYTKLEDLDGCDYSGSYLCTSSLAASRSFAIVFDNGSDVRCRG